jgi:hypothetical protein
VWLLRRPGQQAAPAPEDDVATPVDRALLEEAERELRGDPAARELGPDDDRDWGPGAT